MGWGDQFQFMGHEWQKAYIKKFNSEGQGKETGQSIWWGHQWGQNNTSVKSVFSTSNLGPNTDSYPPELSLRKCHSPSTS